MMSHVITRVTNNPRDTRLSLLVNGTEAEKIASEAANAGQSISAFLRDRALAKTPSKDDQEAEALRLFDKIVDDMSNKVEDAISSLDAALKRMNWPSEG
jgi:hypothetical protein